MDKCYNHSQTNADDRCLYCGKSFCSDCLMLHGERKSVICDHCYHVYEKKLKGSMKRRSIYIVLFLMIALFYAIDIFSDEGDGLFNIFIILPITFFAIVNFVRIRQIKKWLVKEKYIIKP